MLKVREKSKEVVNWEIMGPILQDENELLRKELKKLKEIVFKTTTENLELSHQHQTLSDIVD